MLPEAEKDTKSPSQPETVIEATVPSESVDDKKEAVVAQSDKPPSAMGVLWVALLCVFVDFLGLRSYFFIFEKGVRETTTTIVRKWLFSAAPLSTNAVNHSRLGDGWRGR